jgi:peptidyl-dipeptidase Dcp
MKTVFVLIFLTIFGLFACRKGEKSDNPFFNKYETPFEVPPFDQINISHFMPAYLKGFEEHNKEIDAIVNNTKKPTFKNTIKAMEYSGKLLDMEYHSITEPVDLDMRSFEKNAMDKYGLIPEIKPRYRSAYFSHIWNGGYAAGYYGYIWCEILDADAFQAFKETGNIFNKEVAARFEKEILARRGTRDPLAMYIAFRGKEPGIDALLKNRGLK